MSEIDHQVQFSISVDNNVDGLKGVESKISDFQKEISKAQERTAIYAQKSAEAQAKAAIKSAKESASVYIEQQKNIDKIKDKALKDAEKLKQQETKTYEKEFKKLVASEENTQKLIRQAKERTAQEAERQYRRQQEVGVKSAKTSAQVFAEYERAIQRAKERTGQEAERQYYKQQEAARKSAKASAQVFIEEEKARQKANWDRAIYEQKKYEAQVKANAKAVADFNAIQGQSTSMMGNLTSAVFGGILKFNLLAKAIQLAVQALQSGVGEALNFEKSMALVNTITQLPSEKLGVLSDKVAKLGINLGKMPDEMAKGMYEVVSSTDETIDRIKVLELATKASVAGYADVNTAVDAGTSVMNAYQMSVADLQRIYDIMFKTIDRGKVTFSELNQGLSSMISSAVRAKVPLETMMGQFAFLTQRGIKTEQASTALARAYDALYEKADKFKKVFNIEVYQANGQLRDTTEILAELGTKLKSLDPETKIKAFKAIGFEERAEKSVTLMADNFAKLKETISTVGNSAGQTDKAFAAASDNILTNITKMKASIVNDIYKAIMDNKKEILETIEALKTILTLVVKITALLAKPIKFVVDYTVDEDAKGLGQMVLVDKMYTEYRKADAAYLAYKKKISEEAINEAGLDFSKRKEIEIQYYKDIYNAAQVWTKKKEETEKNSNKTITDETLKLQSMIVTAATKNVKSVSDSNKASISIINKNNKDVMKNTETTFSKTKDFIDNLNPGKKFTDNLVTQVSKALGTSQTAFKDFSDNLKGIFDTIIDNSGATGRAVVKNMLGSMTILSDMLGNNKEYIKNFAQLMAQGKGQSLKAQGVKQSEVENLVKKEYEFWIDFLSMSKTERDKVLKDFDKYKDTGKELKNAVDKPFSPNLDPEDKKKPYNYIEELNKFYKQMDVEGLSANSSDLNKKMKYYESFISFLTNASGQIMDDYGVGSSLLGDVKGKIANSSSNLDSLKVQEKVAEVTKKELDFVQSEISKGVDQSLEPYLTSYKTVLENNIEDITKIENLSKDAKDKLIAPIKDKLNKVNSDLNKINEKKVTDQIVDKIESFLKTADYEKIDKTSKEYLEEYQRTLESAISSFASIDNLTENQKAILLDYQTKLTQVKNDISTINANDEAKKIEDQLLAQYVTAFAGQKEFLVNAQKMNLDINSTEYKTAWNEMLQKQIDDLIKVYTDPKVSEDIKQSIDNAINIAKENMYDSKETKNKKRQLTQEEQDFNDALSASIGLVNNLSSVLGGDFLKALSSVLAGVQAFQAASIQGGLAGTIGKVSAGVAIAGTVYSVLDGITAKGNAKAEAETAKANEAFNNQLEELQKINDNLTDLKGTFNDLRATLVESVTKLPTQSKIKTGQTLMNTAYDALYNQREFGGITTKWNENQDYWDVYKWKNRNREQAYTFSESDVGNLLGVNFDTATIDQLKEAHSKITNDLFYNATTGLGEDDNSIFAQDWNFGYFTGNTVSEFEETLSQYIKMLEEAQKQVVAFERTVKLSSMTGIQVLDAEQQKADLIEKYKDLGITITSDVESQIEQLVSEMGDFYVTIMEDVRTSIIENGGDVAEAMKTYVDAMVNNAFTQIVDSMLGQDFDKLSKMFGELVNLQVSGTDTTQKRIEIAQAMLDTIRKQDKLVDAKTKEVNKLIQALRDLGATEEEIASLGLLDSATTEEMKKMAEDIQSMISDAITAGVDDGFNIDTFSSKLGESIYDSVKTSMIAAMTASLNTKIIDEIMSSYNFDEMFKGMSISEMMTQGQNVMNNIMSQLEANGLDFGNTSGTNGIDSISNSVGLSVDSETAGASIVYHNYNYNPYYAGDVLYGDNASETALFEKFEAYMKNKSRNYS